MTIAKKYYWLKLKEDFFRQKEIKKLRRIAGGDTYTIIYLKLQLLSIKNEGIIEYEGTEEDIVEQLALEIDEDIDNIKVTFAFLQTNNLIEQINQNDYLLNRVPESIGNETDAAERMRKMRENRKKICNNVTPQLQPVAKGYTEIEKEKDIEIELQQDIEENSCGSSEKDFNIFEYMQQRGFVSISPMVYEKINADIELYSLEEVKKAIDIADSNAKHTYNYVKGILEKRRAGVNEKVENETDFKKAMKEFLEE